MITEFWWKVFLFSIATVVIVKLLGCSLKILHIFSLSFIAWTVGLFLLAIISGLIWDKWQDYRKNKAKKE